jgi:hypothetical protein
MTVTYSTDNFNDTNQTTAAPGTWTHQTSGGTLDPLNWTTQLGTCGITANQAFVSATGTGGGLTAGETTVDLSQANVDISLTFSQLSTSAGLMFRFSDTSNFWVVISDASNTKLFKHVGGSGTLTQVGTTHAGTANGDVMEVIAAGSNIIVKRNGTQLENVTDSFNSTATKHGFFSQSTAARFDNWSVSSVVLSSSASLSDTANISDSIVKHLAVSKALSNTDNISNTLTTHRVGLHKTLANTDSISDVQTKIVQPRKILTDLVDISNVTTVTGILVQFDTWRPVPKFDNSLILICRTPLGVHDTDLTNIVVWTVKADGSGERVAIGLPTSNGWVSYSHPEWSPDGQEVVIAVETSTEYQLVTVDASGFGS